MTLNKHKFKEGSLIKVQGCIRESDYSHGALALV